MSDFTVQRGIALLTSTGTDVIITAGVDYTAPTGPAFIRITDSHYVGPNTTEGSRGCGYSCLYVSNPTNIGTSITFQRGYSTSTDCDVYWEIVEYSGSGDNAIVVREVGTVNFTAAEVTQNTTDLTATVSDTNDVVVFITGVKCANAVGADQARATFLAEWDTTNDYATISRGVHGSVTAAVSYAVIEFTGSNWSIQQTALHTFSAGRETETETITSIGDTTTAFVVPSFKYNKEAGTASINTVETWINSTTAIGFQTGATTANLDNHKARAFVVQNDDITTAHYTKALSASGATGETITAVGALADTSLMSVCAYSESGVGDQVTGYCVSVELTTTTNLNYFRAVSTAVDARVTVVEWPTDAGGGSAVPLIIQNME